MSASWDRMSPMAMTVSARQTKAKKRERIASMFHGNRVPLANRGIVFKSPTEVLAMIP
ncbi:hypothetical protein [Ochrobactrum sp. Marseille-Q0166]|uniref:hypothetical protein n=1 Tax=Ochrobactrum sp. Marseille-Q0166 TaxID=2761105 RepID=UPI001655969A|nr:hypothetical protein [Ochrobactrum sp. Marseille-Q0166]MBC8716378.1 hypothetical protein [Ochrobactrum sp. Marseille-Q0166]